MPNNAIKNSYEETKEYIKEKRQAIDDRMLLLDINERLLLLECRFSFWEKKLCNMDSINPNNLLKHGITLASENDVQKYFDIIKEREELQTVLKALNEISKSNENLNT